MVNPGTGKAGWTRTRGAALLSVAVVALGAPLLGASSAAAAPPATVVAPSFTSYRHGPVPPVASHAAQAAATATTNLSYGGGNGGVGVTTGAPKVYLVFWGSQWGTAATNSQGYLTLSGDRNGMAPDIQAFFKGVGTGSELWSGVMTQYCEGVATGSQTCPSSSAHVGYPTGGALAAVWEDTSSAAPGSATGHQLAAEAVNAANHFGNTTQAANRNVQYFIVSPSGTTPDGFNTANGNFCAWHDYSGDSTLPGGAASGPLVAFTNMPYVSDAGSSCGMNFVNAGSAGTLDGATIVGGHEYAETITDQFPLGGWLDGSGNENGDKCAWIRSGQGASQNISLTTGTFAVQSTWANDFNSGAGGCLVSHPIVASTTGNTVTVTSPGNLTTSVGATVNVAISASDSAGAALTFSASGLPVGLAIAPGTGVISGNPQATGASTVTVTAKDPTGATGIATFGWTVNPASSCTARQLLGNPGFETGSAAPWKATSGVISRAGYEPAHSGNWMAWLDGYGVAHTDTLSQALAVPSGCTSYTVSFWRHIDTSRPATSARDTLSVQVLNAAGTTVVQTLATYSNLNAASGFVQVSFNLSAYAGQAITLKFTGVETGGHQTTNFVIDDTAFNVS